MKKNIYTNRIILIQMCDMLDKNVTSQLFKVGGANYTTIASLAWRSVTACVCVCVCVCVREREREEESTCAYMVVYGLNILCTQYAFEIIIYTWHNCSGKQLEGPSLCGIMSHKKCGCS